MQKIIPLVLPMVPNKAPITKGEGKSPVKCITNIAIALACPLFSSVTQFIKAIPTGPVPLSNTYMNIENSDKPISIIKGTFVEMIAPARPKRLPIKVTMTRSKHSFSVLVVSSSLLVIMPWSN